MIPIEDLLNIDTSAPDTESTIKALCCNIPDSLRDFDRLELEDSDGKLVEVEILPAEDEDEKYWNIAWKHNFEMLSNLQQYLADLGEKCWENLDVPYLVRGAQLMADIHSFRTKYESDYNEDWVQNDMGDWVRKGLDR